MEKDILQRLDEIERKLDNMAQILYSIEGFTTPCEEKQKAKKASMEMVMQLVDNSPLSQNPMFKDILQTLRPILEGAR